MNSALVTEHLHTGGGRRPAARFAGSFVPWLAAIAILYPASVSRACPSCATGIEARSQVFGGDFAMQLTIASLPFIIIGVICVWAESIGRVER